MCAKSDKSRASAQKENNIQNIQHSPTVDNVKSNDELLKKMATELENKKKEAEDYLNTLKRLQAEFENFIKRTEKERNELTNYASEKLIVKLLPVFDEFQKSITELKKSANDEVTKGIELVYKNFQKVLQEEGVQPIESIGMKADPFLHEVILTEQNNSVEDGIITEEIQRGYKMKDKVVRYAKVKIARR